MKLRIFCIAFCLALFTLGTQAQDKPQQQRTPPTIEQRLQRWDNTVFSKLDLKDGQKPKLDSVFTDYFGKADAMRNSGERPSREAFEKITNERDEKVKGILSDDQYKKYQNLIQEQMNNRRGGGNGGGKQQSNRESIVCKGCI